MAAAHRDPPVFIDALRGLTRERGGDAAVFTEDRRVTYEALVDEVASLAAWLSRQGVAPGDVVGITIKDEYRNLVASLAAIYAGLAHVTLATHEPAAQRESVARRLGAVAVLGDAADHALPGLPLVVPDFAFRSIDAGPVAQPGDGTCLYLSSSGTTGHAKLIPLAQRQLLAQSVTFRWPQRRNVYYRPASIEFNNSKRHRLYALALGDANVLVDPARHDVRETCRRFDVSLLGLSATQARVLTAGEGDALSDGVQVRMGGSAIPPALRQRVVSRLSPQLFVTYGTSEIGSISTAGPGDHDAVENTVGKAHPGVALQIVGDDDAPLPPGARGRVRVRSAGLPSRYCDDKQATARAFRNGWFYPGDVGHLDESGRLIFDGRADDMMNLASINVFPAEIERVVESLPGVAECAAFAMKSAEFGDVPMVAVVADGSLEASDVLAHAKRALGLRAPRKVFLVDALPQSQGKVLRHELRRLLVGQAPTEPVS